MRSSFAIRSCACVVAAIAMISCSSTATKQTPVATAVAQPALSTAPVTTSAAAVATTPKVSTTDATTTPVTAPPQPSGGLPCAPPATAGGGAPPVTLEMWSVLSDDADKTLRNQILNFNKDHADVSINLTTTGSSGELIDRLATGDRPDLLAIGNEGLIGLTDTGFITSASHCIANDATFQPDDLLPIAAATYQLDGQQVAIPLSVSTPLLYFNRNQFTHAGLDPDKPPQTLADLRRALQKMIDTGTVTQGLTYADASWFVTQWAAQLGVEIGSAGNGHFLSPGTNVSVSLDNPKLHDALVELQSMAKDGLIVPPAINNSGQAYSDLALLIAPKDAAAMALHTSGSLAGIYSLVEKTPTIDVGVGPLPGPGTGALVGGQALWITTSDPAKVWPTWQAIRYFTDAAQQADFGAIGYAPVRLSTLDQPALQAAWTQRPPLRAGFDQLRATSPDPAHLTIAAGTQAIIFNQLDVACRRILDISNPVTVSDALAEAQLSINNVLSVYESQR